MNDVSALMGELRSLLGQTDAHKDQLAQVWSGLRRLIAQAPQRFRDEVEPYLRQSGFLEHPIHDHAFTSPESLHALHPVLEEKVWWAGTQERLERPEEDIPWIAEYKAWSTICYGAPLSLPKAALLAAYAQAQSVFPKGLMWMVPSQEQPELAGQIVCGVRADSTLKMDHPLEEKLRMLTQQLDEAIGLEWFADTPAAFHTHAKDDFIGVYGSSLVFGPLRDIGEEDPDTGFFPRLKDEYMWLNPRRQGKELDHIRKYNELDWECDDGYGDTAPTYECVRVIDFDTWDGDGRVTEKIYSFTLTPAQEQKAIKRLAKSGISAHRHRYELVVHPHHKM